MQTNLAFVTILDLNLFLFSHVNAKLNNDKKSDISRKWLRLKFQILLET